MSIHSDVQNSHFQRPTFYPLHTVRCSGPVTFRSQLARDIGCLLDLDDAVASWSCAATVFRSGNASFRPDFTVERSDVIVCIQSDHQDIPEWVRSGEFVSDYHCEIVDPSMLPAIRLRNAKDLLRYARYEVALADRIRLLAALDEFSTLPLAEAISAFQETRPIAGLASLVLQRFLSIDLDDRLIGPETIVRRNVG